MILAKWSPIVLRVVLSLVFLYFAFAQFTNTNSWIGFVPEGVLIGGLTARTVVLMNAFLELIFGVLLLIGLFTRVSALILSLHLFGIAFSLGWNDLAVRDFGLACATLSVFLHGPDQWCLDTKMNKRMV